MNQLKRTLGLILSVVAFFIYFNTVKHGYVLDDFSIISENTVTTQGIKAIPGIFSHFYRYGYYSMDDGIYRPLSVATFAAEWSLSPNNPSLSHFINVLLYMLTGWVMFITLAKLLKNYNVVVPFIITLLFIAHPVHTEVVANIKSRDELLCFLLSFATLYYLLDYVESLSNKKLAISMLFFFAAFLSKETAITMVVVIPLMLYFFTPAKRQTLMVTISCLSAVAVVFLIIRAGILTGENSHEITAIENLLLTASSNTDRLATAIKILGSYLALLAYPAVLLYDRSFNQIPIVNFSNVYVWIALLIYIGLGIYALWGFFKRDFLAFGVLFYLITISLFSNIAFTIGVAMADRFVYFASFGFCFALAVILVKITKTPIKPISFLSPADFYNRNKTVLLVTIALGFLYSVKSINRNAAWKDNYTLFRQDLKFSPDNARAHSFLGNEIIKTLAPRETDPSKRTALCLEGINELKRSLEIYPDHPDALNSIGMGYFQIDSVDAAEYYFKKGLVQSPAGFNKLGDFYRAKRDYNKAIELYKKAIALNPGYLDAHINLGICFGTIMRYEDAIRQFNEAAAIQPKNPQVYYLLSTAYKFKGDSSNYDKYYQKAWLLDPTLVKP